jgi:tRNA(Ile)-lysidine synthase
VAALAPAVAAVRAAVRHALSEVRRDGTVLVACSGGADSLALAACTAFVAPRLGVHSGLITVDHGLQQGSAERAAAVAAWAASVGLAPVIVSTVDVAGREGGPEAAARDARYEALVAETQSAGAEAVLLGHTRDDQAETVLLALARGAGPRGLAGMPVRRTVGSVALVRPLLDISREQTVQCCAALGLAPWQDPHNSDPAYTRTRVRAVLPALVEALGPAVVPNLARTAALVAVDVAALDGLADAALTASTVDEELTITGLVDLPPALRTRVLHRFAGRLGAPGAALSHRHVVALDALVVAWHGQGPVALPGGILVARYGDRLRRVPGPNAAM